MTDHHAMACDCGTQLTGDKLWQYANGNLKEKIKRLKYGDFM